MDTLSSYETSVLTRTTQRNNPGDRILHSHRRGNLKSYELVSIYLTLQAALGPGGGGGSHPLTEISIRGIVKQYFLGVELSRCLRLTTLPLSVIRLSRRCWIFSSSQLYRSPRPVTEIALIFVLLSYSRRRNETPSTMSLMGPLIETQFHTVNTPYIHHG
jgi:hypothetical protein